MSTFPFPMRINDLRKISWTVSGADSLNVIKSNICKGLRDNIKPHYVLKRTRGQKLKGSIKFWSRCSCTTSFQLEVLCFLYFIKQIKNNIQSALIRLPSNVPVNEHNPVFSPHTLFSVAALLIRNYCRHIKPKLCFHLK